MLKRYLVWFLLFYSSASFSDIFYYVLYQPSAPNHYFDTPQGACDDYLAFKQTEGYLVDSGEVYTPPQNGTLRCSLKYKGFYSILESFIKTEYCPTGEAPIYFGNYLCLPKSTKPPTCNSSLSLCIETTFSPAKNLGNNPQQCEGLVRYNPINIGTGNKFQTETDYQGNGDFPLVFKRFIIATQ